MTASPRIVLVVAAAENNVIGRDGGMPWHLPDDLRHFKRTTIGHPVIMGRRTWAELGGRPLLDRRNIVLTRDAAFEADGADIVHSIDDAIALAGSSGASEVMIIGGGEIYRQSIDRAQRIELTRVHAEVEGDVTFPGLGDDWSCLQRTHHEADERHAHPFTFETWERA